MVDQEDFLEHFGVKGMRWGVRHQPISSKPTLSRRAQNKLAKADTQWQKNIYTTKSAIDVHNHMADKMNNGELDRLNGQAKYKNISITDPNSPKAKQYYAEYERLAERLAGEAVTAIHGTSPSGNYVAKLDSSDREQWKVVITPTGTAAHSATDVVLPQISINLNVTDGFITSAQKVRVSSMAQSSDVSSEFLEHFGVKGMRWGVRKRKSAGVVHPMSEDARTARDHINKAHENSVRSLSNKDIEQVIRRMNLEKQFREVDPRPVKTGLDRVKSILGRGNTLNDVVRFAESPVGKLLAGALIGGAGVAGVGGAGKATKIFKNLDLSGKWA